MRLRLRFLAAVVLLLALLAVGPYTLIDWMWRHPYVTTVGGVALALLNGDLLDELLSGGGRACVLLLASLLVLTGVSGCTWTDSLMDCHHACAPRVMKSMSAQGCLCGDVPTADGGAARDGGPR